MSKNSKTTKNTVAAIGLASMLFLGYKALGQRRSDTDIIEPDTLPQTPPKNPAVKPKTTVKSTLTVWETWEKELGGSAGWYKQCYDSGIRNKYVAHVLVVLRVKKDLGYNRSELVAKYDDVARASYLKWAVKTWQGLKLRIGTLPTVYKKAFNQDLKIQYQSIYSKVVPLVDPVSVKDIWDGTKPVQGLIGLM